MTVEELKRRMSLSEFYQWMALERIEPFGEQGHYLRLGILAALIANGFKAFSGDKTGKTFKPEDFMPKVPKMEETRKAKEENSIAQLHAFMMGLVNG